MTEDRRLPPLDPSRHALFLDFDGTIVDFAPAPEAISLRPGTAALLAGLGATLGGALAIVSGRRIADLDRYLAPPEFPAAGVHGHELRRPGRPIERLLPSPEIALARGRLHERMSADDPLRLEDKEFSLVLHFRAHPDLEPRAAELAREAAQGLATLRVDHGNRIFEIRPVAVSKARALDLLRDPPFAGRIPVFVGDDVTDEDGIRAAAAVGGFGIKVGPGETAASHRFPDVTAVHEWLAGIATRSPARERPRSGSR